MRNTHLSVSLVFAAVLGFVLGNCGGSSSSSSGPTACPPGGASTCTKAELAPYTNCIIGKCSSTLSTCFGPSFQSGNYGGTCGATYVGCTQKCGCGDTACFLACGQPSADCAACLQTVSACVDTSACVAPTNCSGGGTGGTTGGGAGGHIGGLGGFPGGLGGITGTSGTCADLLACCNAIANASVKAACMSEYTTLMAQGDAQCGAAVSGLRAGGACP